MAELYNSQKVGNCYISGSDPLTYNLDRANSIFNEYQGIDLSNLLNRASHPYSITPHPFLKWAGSKRFLLHHIVPLLPKRFRIYREPFLGSGALFFLLSPERAVLSDTATELVEMFRAVRDNIVAVKRYLSPLTPCRETFYAIRENQSKGRFRRAAEFIFLNKTCWNGLYRVNSAGKFNVPYGYPKSLSIVNFDNMDECSVVLGNQNVDLRICDFEENLQEARVGDLVYLDPPYVTGHNNNGFIDYNEVLFSWNDQIRLATIARRLASQGVSIIVSNADHEEICKLYPGFTRITFTRSSTLAASAERRKRISEVLLVSIGESF